MLVPLDYCPPGFKNVPIEKAPTLLFNGPSVNHHFGQAANDHLGCILELERRQDKNYEIEDLTLEQSQPLLVGQPTQHYVNQQEQPSTQMPSPDKTSPTQAITCSTNNLTIEPPKLIQPKFLATTDIVIPITCPPKLDANSAARTVMNVKCYCDDSLVSDLDMIQCEDCSMWQHTVCVGFFGNNDPRIQNFHHNCFGCLFRDEPPQRAQSIFSFLKDLTNFRRVLSVTFNEQVSNHNWLGKRLSLHFRKAKKYFERMKSEGFIIKMDPQHSQQSEMYQTVRTKFVREQIRKYFNPNIHSFPQIQKLMTNKNGKVEEKEKKRTAAEMMAMCSVVSCMSEI